MNTVFFDDPLVIFKKDQITKIWPRPEYSMEDRVNASARFILFATCGLYLYTRDVRVFSIAFLCFGILYMLFRNNKIPKIPTDCHLPTPNNPMSNFLQPEWNTNRKPSCEYKVVKPLVNEYMSDRFLVGNTRSRAPMPEQQKYAAARQWIMNPARDNPNAQMEFAEFCYGKKFQPTCRDDPSMCDPNARGAQLEAFAGLDPAGTGRMHGGGAIKYSS